MILLFKMPPPLPQCSAKALSGVPKRKKAAMCLLEKINVLDELCSGVSYNAAGYEFNANESTVYIK